MPNNRPEALALRTVHQYRRRDILPYLGLRLYLNNIAARHDGWVERVCAKLLLARTNQPYLRSLHSKEVAADGTIKHRELHLPGPTEALVESLLLQCCAGHIESFQPFPNVFSYRLSQDDRDTSGIFKYYLGGFKARQLGIHKAINDGANTVIYTDIKRFYPSITTEMAKVAWNTACNNSSLSSSMKAIGYKLLHDYSITPREPYCLGLLTGPIFSHLVANLVLRKIDESLSIALPGGYLRYVDDIVLVGTKASTERAETLLAKILSDMGFELNESKRLLVDSATWLQYAASFEETHFPSWKSFVGSLKQFLVCQPHRTREMASRLQDAGFRIVPLDYSAAIQDAKYRSRFLQLFTLDWFRRKLGRVSIDSIVKQGLYLRSLYQRQFEDNVTYFDSLQQFQAKQALHKLKYLSSRLAYIGNPDYLESFSSSLSDISPLHVHAEVFKSLATGDVTLLSRYGANAAQAAAQPLKALFGKSGCVLNAEVLDSASTHALAILTLNGIDVRHTSTPSPEAETLYNFATVRNNAKLLTCDDGFIRELACLRGPTQTLQQSELLDTAFDIGDDLPFDMTVMLDQSGSGYD